MASSAVESMSDFAPYTLSLCVLYAENLPIADYTTSDPYVVIRLSGKVLGRTQTIKRNHKRPEWNEVFPKHPLFDLDSTVEFHIFDEDQITEDELMGIVKFNLSDIRSIGTTVQKAFAVENAGNFKADALFYISVKIDRAEGLIKILPTVSNNIISTAGTNFEDLDKLKEKKSWEASPKIVQDVFETYSAEGRTKLLNVADMTDSLYDVSTLSPKSLTEEVIEEQYQSIFHRNQLKLINSSRIELDDFVTYRHAPLDENCLQINLSLDETKYIVVTFYNRFSMWNWCMWLKLAYDFWNGKFRRSDLPSWAETLSRSTEIKCAESNKCTHETTCRMILNLDYSFELRIGEFHYDLRTMHSIVICTDSMPPKAYCLDVVISDISLDGTSINNDPTTPTTPHAKDKEAEKRLSLRGALKSTVKNTMVGAVKGISTAKNLAVGTATGIATTTLHTAKNIGTGNVGKIVKDAQEGVVMFSNTLASTVKTAPHAFLNRKDLILLFKCDADFACLGQNSSLGSWYFDFYQDELRGKNIENNSTVPKHVYPPKVPSVLAIDMMLLHGVEGSIKMAGQDSLRMIDLIRFGGNSSKSEAKRSKGSEYNLELVNHSPKKLESMMGLTVSIIEANNLAVPLNLHHRNLVAKCKLADEYGHSGFKGTGNDFKAPSLPAQENVIWKPNNFIIKVDEHVARPRFLRVELVIEEMTSSYSAGAIFVPLEYANLKTSRYTFPVSRFRMHSSCLKFAHQRGTGFGEITIELKKIVEAIEETKQQKLPTIVFSSRLNESNLFNNSWYAECIPSGSVDATEHICVEAVQVSPQHDKLLLLEVGTERTITKRHYQKKLYLEDENSQRQESELSQALSDVPVYENDEALRQALETKIIEIDIEIYENVRRQPYPPFDWSDSAFTRPKFSDFSYKKGFRFATLNDAELPPGCIWVDETFYVDTGHTATDKAGWTYGFTFGKILENYVEGKSIGIASANTHARRRLWRRKLRAIDEHISSLKQLQDLFYKHNLSRSGTSAVSDSSKALSPVSPLGRPSSKSVSSSSTGDENITANSTSHAWRRDVFYSDSQERILATCQEKLDEDSPIMIEWDSILSITVITPSILHLKITVHRYFPDTSSSHNTANNPGNNTSSNASAKFSFKSIMMEIYISNCPAKELKSLLEERRFFYKYRDDIQAVMKSGALYENDSSTTEADIEAAINDANTEIPETEELSCGAQLMAALDSELIFLEKRYKELETLLATARATVEETLATEKERDILNRRILRIRLYIASLLNIGLSCSFTLNEKNIRKIMEVDFLNAKKLDLKNEVQTTANRIEYLLDMAEKRIRDITLCGWSHADEIPHWIEILSNGYFMEIASLLGKFLEDRKKQSSLVGLENKIELIHTFVKNNYRLDILIESALRPYHLRASPPAKLSMYLNFPLLLSWYSTMMTQEMRSKVDNVMNVWKDKSKDASGESGHYNYPIPWIPSAVKKHDGAPSTKFFTMIPEELTEFLNNYIEITTAQYQTIEDELHQSRFFSLHSDSAEEDKFSSSESDLAFHQSLLELQEKMVISFTNAFLYLAEQYQASLLHYKDYLNILRTVGGVNNKKEKDAQAKSGVALDSEEMEEYATWVASVQNDVSRILSKDLILVGTKTKGNKGEKDGSRNILLKTDRTLYEKTMNTFSVIQRMSIDQLANISWKYALAEKVEIDFLQPYAFPSNVKTTVLVQAWKQFTQKYAFESKENDIYERSFFVQQFQCIHDIFADYQNYFVSMSEYLELFDNIWCKYFLLFFYLLNQLAFVGEVYSMDAKDISNSYLVQLNLEISALTKYYHQCVDDIQQIPSLPSTEHLRATSMVKLLELLMSLLTLDLFTPKIIETINKLGEISRAENSNIFAESTARCIEICLSLRSVKKFCNPIQNQKLEQQLKKAGTPVVNTSEGTATKRSSFTSFSTPSNTVASPAPKKGPEEITPANAQAVPPAAKKRSSILGYFYHGKEEAASPLPAAPSGTPVTQTPPSPPSVENSSNSAAAVVPPATVDISDSANTAEDDEVEDLDMANMQLARERSFIECIDSSIQDIRYYHIRKIHSNVNSDSAKSINSIDDIREAIKQELLSYRQLQPSSSLLNFYPPICRIFGPEELAQFSIKTQLLHSSVVNIHRLPNSGKFWMQENAAMLQGPKAAKKRSSIFGGGGSVNGGNSTSNSGGGILHILTGTIPMFQKKTASSTSVSAAGDGNSDSVTAEDPRGNLKRERSTKFNTVNEVSAVEATKNTSHLEESLEKPELIIIIQEITLSNFFNLDMFHYPKPYMKFFVRNPNDPSILTAENAHDVVITSAKEGKTANILIWTAKDETVAVNSKNPNASTFRLPIYQIGNSQLELVIELWYKGYYQDSYVGWLTIPFSPFDPIQCRQKEFVVEDFSKGAKNAVEKALKEGRHKPTFLLSLDYEKAQ